MDGLGSVAHGERVHFRAKADELDNQIAFCLVVEVAHFAGVEFSIRTSDVGKVSRTYLAEIECVSIVRARVYLFGQVFHKEVKEKRVGVRVQHSDSLTEGVFE